MRQVVVDISRGLAAAAVLLSAVTHLDVWDLQDYRAIPTIGPLFLLNGLGGIVLGVVVVTWRHWLPALSAAGFGLVTVIFFWISVEHGLFGLKESATGPSQNLAQIAEYAAILFGLVAAAGLWVKRRPVETAPPRARRDNALTR